MNKLIRCFTPILIMLFLISVIIIPASAIEVRGVKYCPYCWVPLTILYEYEELEEVYLNCPVTQGTTDYVHPHMMYYWCEDFICPTCSYTVTVRTKTKERCWIGGYSLKDI